MRLIEPSLSPFEISLTFLSGSIPDSPIITGIIFDGSNLFIEFLNCLFFASSNSRNIRLSSASYESAGLRSINICSGFFIVFCFIAALADKISGPLTPKCVKSISPKSSYSFFLPSYIVTKTFFKDKP